MRQADIRVHKKEEAGERESGAWLFKKKRNTNERRAKIIQRTFRRIGKINTIGENSPCYFRIN